VPVLCLVFFFHTQLKGRSEGLWVTRNFISCKLETLHQLPITGVFLVDQWGLLHRESCGWARRVLLREWRKPWELGNCVSSLPGEFV